MSNLNENLEALFGKMENFISTKTVVGDPVNVGDITIVPLIDVTFGVGAGSSDQNEDKSGKAKGAGGLGAKITPSAVLVIQDGTVQLVNVKNTSSIDKLLNMAPGIVSKLDLGSVFKSKDKETPENN